MSELLIRAVDKINPDFYLNTKCTKRGDVIVVSEDGWNWGVLELKDPQYAIVKWPGVSVSEASVLLAPEIDTDPKNPSRTLQRRAFRLDLDHPDIPPALKQDLAPLAADAKDLPKADRAKPTLTMSLPKAFMQTLIVAKPTIADPDVIGDSEATLG